MAHLQIVGIQPPHYTRTQKTMNHIFTAMKISDIESFQLFQYLGLSLLSVTF